MYVHVVSILETRMSQCRPMMLVTIVWDFWSQRLLKSYCEFLELDGVSDKVLYFPVTRLLAALCSFWSAAFRHSASRVLLPSLLLSLHVLSIRFTPCLMVGWDWISCMASSEILRNTWRSVQLCSFSITSLVTSSSSSLVG